jgi:hypothetical protein
MIVTMIMVILSSVAIFFQGIFRPRFSPKITVLSLSEDCGFHFTLKKPLPHEKP